MRASEFKKRFDAIREKDRVVVISGKGYSVYADAFEIPYRAVATAGEASADITLFYDRRRVAYVVLGTVEDMGGVYS
jgi:hypothetical protein